MEIHNNHYLISKLGKQKNPGYPGFLSKNIVESKQVLPVPYLLLPEIQQHCKRQVRCCLSILLLYLHWFPAGAR